MLVFPDDSNPVLGKISVLAPIGTFMLGYRVDDTFEKDTSIGKRMIHVEKITNLLEAAGGFK